MDIGDLKEILRILEEQEITEFELEQDGVKLRVCRSAPSRAAIVVGAPPALQAPATPVTAAVSSAPSVGEARAAGVTAADEGAAGVIVKSPIVGTFYRASDPNSAPFVNVGDRIKVGQVVCIIEAMKLMNEIEAELAGEVVKIHVENGQAVQYGDPLFSVRPA